MLRRKTLSRSSPKQPNDRAAYGAAQGRLRKTLKLLAESPAMGSRRLPHRPDLRSFPCDRYLISNRPLAAGDGIDLLRIRPASSDWMGSLDLATP